MLIYIGGYGRSGSTLLEYLLTAHPSLVACGEVERHLRRFGRRKICTCGRRAKKCWVWSRFQHRSGELEGWDHKKLVLAILDHVTPNYTVMVDSSKTSWGSTRIPFRLSKALGENFVLVHIVRDPRAVAWSTMKARLPQRSTTEGKLKLRQKSRSLWSSSLRPLRTVVGWTVANLACETFGILYPDQYLRVRYEDLVRTPVKVLGQIFAKVSLEPPLKLEQNTAARNRHQLYGNAMRFDSLSPAELKEDVAWKAAMPKAYRWLVGILCWSFCMRYDYELAVDAG
jgi:hypothetical protein